MDVEESFTTSEVCDENNNTNRAVGAPFVLFRRHEKPQMANVHQDEIVARYRNQQSASPWGDYHSGPPHQTLAMEEPLSRGQEGHKHPYNNNIFHRLSLICDEIEMSHPFVRKVIILCVQLVLIFALTLGSMTYIPIKFFLREHTTTMIIMFHVFFFTYLSLICFKPLRRKFPLNYVFLLMFTISMNYYIAYFSSLFHMKVLRVVVPTNMLICFVTSLATCQKKFNITKWFFIIAPASIFMFVFGTVSLVSTIMGCRILWVICCGLLFPHFSVFMLYDFLLYSAFKRFFILPYDDMHFGREAYGIITGKM